MMGPSTEPIGLRQVSRRAAALVTAVLTTLTLIAVTSSSAADGTAVSGPQIDALIAQLGHADYSTRQYAQDQLTKLGMQAYEALSAAATHEDLEVAARARYLLRLMWKQWLAENSTPEVQQLLQGYELQSTEERRVRIQSLAVLPRGQGVPALCRLIRFENSGSLSNQAALAILYSEPADNASQARLNKTIRENLAGIQRPAVKWLLAYLKLREDPKDAMPEWTRLVEAEVARMQRSLHESDTAVASGLLYLLADAQSKHGDAEQAEKNAQRALGLCPGNDAASLSMHLQSAYTLQRRGLFKWAEAEYRRVAGSGHPLAIHRAGYRLAEMLHDQGRDEAAAETLRTTLADLARTKRRDLDVDGRSLAELRARMHYFSACHWKDKGDRAKHIEQLEAALAEDEMELDALIAYFRIPEPTEEQRRKADKRIEKATKSLREQVEEEPDDPNAYNQFAWLVGNTKGNMDEALTFSQKSLELSPNNGAYLDTLGHVYFARGEYQRAVECQAQAVEVEPHQKQIAHKLAVFREAAEANRKGAAKPSS